MKVKLALGLLVLVVAVVFSLQNAAVVDVNFLAWKFTTPLALIFFTTLAAGLDRWPAVAQAESGKETNFHRHRIP